MSSAVTTTITRRVKPGHEAAYERFLEGIVEAASSVPGYLGAEIARPRGADGSYRIVYRFDSATHLRGWLDSDEHQAWLERAEPHVAGPMQTQFLTGLETWFTVPAGSGTAPPPPYKMALLPWVAIFPLISGIVVGLGPVLAALPLVPRLAVTTALTVPLMTWVVMPRLTWALRAWLYPTTEEGR